MIYIVLYKNECGGTDVAGAYTTRTDADTVSNLYSMGWVVAVELNKKNLKN